MDGRITVKYLQSYIREKDHNPECVKDYALKLMEEVGELASAIRKNLKAEDQENIKNTIDEEIWDVIYYALALANHYDIDVEQVIKVKTRLSEEKYPGNVKFEMDR